MKLIRQAFFSVLYVFLLLLVGALTIADSVLEYIIAALTDLQEYSGRKAQ